MIAAILTRYCLYLSIFLDMSNHLLSLLESFYIDSCTMTSDIKFYPGLSMKFNTTNDQLQSSLYFSNKFKHSYIWLLSLYLFISSFEKYE